MGRLKQGSTWAGFATLGQMGAAIFPQYGLIFHCITAAAAGVAGALNS